jgi:deazaflavin-dependent oxidoreductase (nitroreductase family)
MKLILRSPLHSIVSKNVMLISFTGRKSGKTFTTPVSYIRDDGEVMLFTHSHWWLNLKDGAAVTLRIQGKDVSGKAEPTAEDKTLVAAGLRTFLSRVPRDAQFYHVRLDAGRQPNAEDVLRAAQSTIMIRVHMN